MGVICDKCKKTLETSSVYLVTYVGGVGFIMGKHIKEVTLCDECNKEFKSTIDNFLKDKFRVR